LLIQFPERASIRIESLRRSVARASFAIGPPLDAQSPAYRADSMWARLPEHIEAESTLIRSPGCASTRPRIAARPVARTRTDSNRIASLLGCPSFVAIGAAARPAVTRESRRLDVRPVTRTCTEPEPRRQLDCSRCSRDRRPLERSALRIEPI
jgi:hypothetical protein